MILRAFCFALGNDGGVFIDSFEISIHGIMLVSKQVADVFSFASIIMWDIPIMLRRASGNLSFLIFR